MIRSLILMFLLGFTRQEFPGWFCDIVIYRHIRRSNLKVNFLIYTCVWIAEIILFYFGQMNILSHIYFSLFNIEIIIS